MKAGKTLQDLAAELDRQAKTKQDLLVDLVKTARSALVRALTEAEEEDVPVEEDTAAKEDAPVEEDAPAEEKAVTITLEEVRAKLAALSQGGKQAEVKALITKYGAQKLSDIPEDKYQALLKEAEEI